MTKKTFYLKQISIVPCSSGFLITVQVNNEYGSYYGRNDRKYAEHDLEGVHRLLDDLLDVPSPSVHPEVTKGKKIRVMVEIDD